MTIFKELLQTETLDIAAPHVTHCGGLGVMKTDAGLCDLYGVSMASRNISSPIGTVAGAHLTAVILNFVAEYHAREVPWWNDMVACTGGNGAIMNCGYTDFPEGSGLGIELAPRSLNNS